ncbi:4-hydroxy-tetrahydrodipicolinate reductase [Acetivibrio mesophilus]|uniref:4-hydroxy-tetrahydrodipicolinate reductase n=1 Tax=Acetivibrio mesophilus TaxID=2487273 RepID=A0A4Q0I5Z1_9FIRM|nr:4-hydroxy-tetrahydrodipicolinate reductase [Acetivibrio mesophilus]ODM25189.1 4-hydroxy-tetrahydrodipicolinate reductase [Clostridium sp. Bc-iso-3]RXE59794.1 4-hydroxy-tetrahydrodipicolinate reductase [Acetivibrio mesophilus]HHV29285.1 4-hydroxy-tetrahydrodipicolinate reductase [Clostridium sp.]
MINILLSGCNGKMGQVISKLASEKENLRIAAGFDINTSIQNPYPVYTDLNKCDIKIDVIIDFSHPSVLQGLLEFAVAKKIPAVIATTGLSSSQIKMLHEASKNIPIFFSANMSIGVNLLLDLVRKAAKVLEGNFDIEIIEKHHNQKIDAPSGTALAIADAINSVLTEQQEYIYDRHSRRKKRNKKEIGIHAVRGGTIVGDHSVIFAGNDEIIEINHIATSKHIFAEGSLNAAAFLHDKKPGMYSMDELIESK